MIIIVVMKIVAIIIMIVIDDCHSLFSFSIQAINPYIHLFMEGSLEVKLPTIWTDEKQSMAEAARREKIRREKSREEKESEERRCRCAKR